VFEWGGFWYNKSVDVCVKRRKQQERRPVNIAPFSCYNKAMEEYAIKFQDGLIKNGRNGLQVEEALQQCVERLNQYQSKVPCRENSIAITHMETAILWLNKRTKDREKRGVEGTYEV
jgi:hypothetical protein